MSCDALGVTSVKKIAVSIIVVCIVVGWTVFPIFIESPDAVLVLNVKPSMNRDCPAESACFTLELRNRGPWPITIDMKELQVYPSLIGPNVNVNWLEGEPSKSLVLMPFTSNTHVFSIIILPGLLPPDSVYVVLITDVTVLYVPHQAVLHSGKR
jgi:hypothetical protein